MSGTDGDDLIRALLAYQRDKAWGTIDVDAGSTHTCIYVADGKPVFAEEGTLSDTLGRFLLREGVLTETQYATILARMTERLVESEPMRFGEVAVALGYLTVQQVHDALAGQIRQKVIRCLGQTQATFTFRASRDWAREVGRFPSEVEPLILHATATFDEERVETLLRTEEPAFARLVGTAEDIAATFHLGAGEARWLESIDGTHTTHDLLAATEIDAGAVLTALLLCGYLALEVRTPSIAPASRVVRPAPATRRRLMMPARTSAPKLAPHQEPTPESRAHAEANLRQLWEARRARTPSIPTPKTPQEARLLAEAAFQLGLGHLRTNTFAKAAQELRHAAGLLPAATEYSLYAQWAEFARDESMLDEAKRKVALRALAVSADAVLEQVSDLGFAYYVLGQVQLHEGYDEPARRLFKRAHRLDPNLVDAERHVRLLELRKRRSAPSQAELEGPGAAPKGAVAKIALKRVAVPVAAAAPAPEAPSSSSRSDEASVGDTEPEAPSSSSRSDEASVGDTEPVPEPVPEHAVLASAPPRSRVGALLGGGLLMIVVAGALLVFVPSRPALAPQRPVAIPTSTATATATAKSPALAASLRDAGSELWPPEADSQRRRSELGASPPTSTAPPIADDGELTTGPSGAGHRLLVDGHSIGDGPGPYRVRCGAHTVQIGSHGKEQQIDVPCGGKVRVE